MIDNNKEIDNELELRIEDLKDLAAAADSQVRNDDVDRRLKAFLARQNARKRSVRLWRTVIAAAACVAVLLTVGIWKDEEKETLTKEDAPIVFHISKPQANVVVKSESGRKISSAAIDKEELVAESLPAAEERLVVDVPQGEKLTVTLPDGSRVYLHAGSSLKFPTKFNDSIRLVELKGEAYFAVAKNKEKPFVVKTRTMQTTVLGTEFNVKAQGTADDNVVLVSGSVSVAAAGTRLIVKPGQMLKVGSDGRLTVEEVDVTPYTLWRDGYIYFDDVTLKDALIAIAREFNCDVEFSASALLDLKVHFVADRGEGIGGVVEGLNMMGIVGLKLEGRVLKVTAL